jgi:molybdopterin-guanine dinucleotide biosynthesis protein A
VNISALDDIAGLVLAGGKSRRFGGRPKALALLAGEPLIAHALRTLKPLNRIAINANDASGELARFGVPILGDLIADAGPLGGVHAGLAWASASPGIAWLATVPVDTPFLPEDFVARLAARRSGAHVIVAATPADFSPVCALWRIDQLPLIEAALRQGVRKMTDYLARTAWTKAEIAAPDLDPLANINDAEQLKAAERLLLQRAARR